MKEKKLQPNVYPTQYEKHVKIKDGTRVLLRPLKWTDEDLWINFFYSLSSVSKQFRFLDRHRQLTPEIIKDAVQIDYVNHFALVAIVKENEQDLMIGVVRYRLDPPPDSASIVGAVLDDWQGMGLGTKMLVHLLHIMIEQKIRKVHGDISLENRLMLRLLDQSGFKVIEKDSAGVRHFEFQLSVKY